MSAKRSLYRYLFIIMVVGVLVWGLGSFLPDGKIHAIFCNVGQGDATYIRLPNNSDILVDGGPNSKVLECLGRYMPFYDRTIDVVVLTHPQKDHFGGLSDVLERYTIKYFVTVPISNPTASFESFTQKVLQKTKTGELSLKYASAGQQMVFDSAKATILWPESLWLREKMVTGNQNNNLLTTELINNNVLGVNTSDDLNLFSIYLLLEYGNFQLLLTGDGDQNTQSLFLHKGLQSFLKSGIKVLKVPHHGSKTAALDEFLNLVQPQISIIEVGKNNYGHPNQALIDRLSKWGQVFRTDLNGDIEVISDGEKWEVRKDK